jgi:cysteine desulfurase
MTCRCSLHKRIAEARISPVTASSAYFDYNATTPVDKRVLGAYYRAASDLWAHPESVHFLGVSVFEELERITGEIAFTLGVPPAGVSYCSSGSEGLHAGIWGS